MNFLFIFFYFSLSCSLGNNGYNGSTVSMTGLNSLSFSSWFAHGAVTVHELVGATVGMGDIVLLEGLALPASGIGLCLMWVWVFWALRGELLKINGTNYI